MSYDENQELFEEAQSHFIEGRYPTAEPLLNQLILNNNKSPDTFHMLGTIYYDQGKFNKAIRAFQRAIQIDPSFTDASIGLSIILNDLGRYEEGRKVFNEAQAMLSAHSQGTDEQIDETISTKHDELGELYFRYDRYKEALEQYYKSLNLSKREPEITMNIIECYIRLDEVEKSIKLLKALCSKYPDYFGARIKLGKVYYDSHQIPEAIEEWEKILEKDPDNLSVKEYLQMAQSIETTRLGQETTVCLD